MGFVVIYDANVLYPSTLRDVLLRVAQTGARSCQMDRRHP
jgi:hypothetical protein